MAWELNSQSVPGWHAVLTAQKVLSSRQWHPQPVGQTSWVRNHSIMWLVWPPCPQVRQKLEEPRTATWQMAHWKVKPLQTAHWVPRTSLRQWLQYTPNSAGGNAETARRLRAGGITDKAALHTAPRSDEPLKLPQSSIRMGEWMVFRDLGLFSIHD